MAFEEIILEDPGNAKAPPISSKSERRASGPSPSKGLGPIKEHLIRRAQDLVQECARQALHL
eukprot:9974251-Alexandrium_andersonii.AAC.1